MMDEVEFKRICDLSDRAWDSICGMLSNDAGAANAVLTILARFLTVVAPNLKAKNKTLLVQDILKIINETLDVNTKLLNNNRRKK